MSTALSDLITACGVGDLHTVQQIIRCYPDKVYILNGSDSRGTPLIVACEHGSTIVVEVLLTVGADVNVEYIGETALHKAADRGHLEIIHLLIKAGCKVDVAFLNDKCTLLNAAFHGNTELVKCLLQKVGCNVNVVNKAGETALHKAVKGGHLEIVHLLMEAGCKVDVGNVNGETTLMIASIYNQIEIVKLLISVGCNMNVVNKAGKTALHEAVERGHSVIVHLLMEVGCKVDVAFLNDWCILLNAAFHGNTELVECLIQKVGCNVNVVNKVGETALHKAVERGHLEIVHLLIKAGCKVDVAFLNDKCTLINAAFHGNTELVECLIQKIGCNVNVVNKVGETALHKAVEGGHLEIVHLLLKAGCKVDAAFLNCNCTLLNAAFHGNTELVECLIQKVGCNVNVVSKVGETALHIAVEGCHLEIVYLLIKAGCKVDVAFLNDKCTLLLASVNANTELVNCLLEKGCQVAAVNYIGETALHKAAEKGHLEIIHLLMKAGCQVDVVSWYLQTALMKAVMTSQADVVKYLLEKGSKVNLKDGRDRTALHYSAAATDSTIPLMLLEAGADLDAQDENGETFADLANDQLLQSVKSKLLSLESRRMVCIIGHPKVGKSTLVKAIRESNKDYRFKKRRNVKNIPNRTAGIDVKTLDDEKFGKMIFFDFAGQSEYYSSHYAFLEAALSSRGTIITFLMVVDLRIPYKERVDQCMEWLSPIQLICTSNVQIHVTLIGSHLDDVSFLKQSEITDSHSKCFQELKSNFNHSNIEFIDCLSMDCRKLYSQGLQQLESYFKSYNKQSLARQETESIVSKVPLRACLFWKKVEHQTFVQLSSILQILSSPYTISLIHTCCQDLSSAGLALYLPNKEMLEDGWLILEIQEVITDIYGKLFAPKSVEFPMHHKDLANKFGLVLSSELDHAFEFTSLSPKLIKNLLISMEFCHPVDSDLLRDEIRSLLVTQDEWLYFPSLVSQDAPLNPFGSSPSDVQSCVWLCWELRGLGYPFLSPRFQYSIFLRLAHKFIQKVTDDQESQILQHSCTVWKNGIFWSTEHEVDFQVQTFSSKATVQVLVRSRNGMDPLMKEAPKVIQEVIKVKEHHCPNMKTVSVLVKVKGGIPSGVQAAVSSIIKTVEKGGTAVVPYGSEEITTIPLSEFFYDWSLSQDCVPLLKQMNQTSVTEHSPEGDDPLRKVTSKEIMDFQQIQEFLTKKDFLERLRECDVRGLGPDLLSEGVIDIDEADDIGHNKGMKEAADNLYMILHRDKSTKKLTALREYLYTNTTKGTHKDLADMISEFLGIAGITSTPTPDLLNELVCNQVSPNWMDFGHHLGVEMSLLKRIERDVKQTASDGESDEAIWRRCFNELSAKWLSSEEDTGDLPRTWKSVLKGLKKSGFGQLASEMEKRLSGKRKSESGSGSDNRVQDCTDIGDADAIREFLGTKLKDLSENCDVKCIAPDLLHKKVITNAQYQAMITSEVERAGAFLYGYLHNDPSNRKLQLLSDVLLESEHDRNRVLGQAILGYLSSHQ